MGRLNNKVMNQHTAESFSQIANYYLEGNRNLARILFNDLSQDNKTRFRLNYCKYYNIDL